MKRVLFVCLGNICRSPMAEGIFKELVREKGLSNRFQIDSAGTGAYHAGELPDPRMRSTAASHGLKLTSRARQLRAEDFTTFDLIIAMDRSNFNNIRAEAVKASVAEADFELRMMREFDDSADHEDVPDPYYGGDSSFEDVYQMLKRSCNRLLELV